MTKMLAELIPIKHFKENDDLDFRKCRACGKEYEIYHILGVCFDCHIDYRIKHSKVFQKAIKYAQKAYSKQV